MEIHVLDQGFRSYVVVDDFISAIWTERFFGDDDFELVVSATQEMNQVLKPGTFLSEHSSEVPMIIEESNIEEGTLKVTGTSITPWLNNRFIRASPFPTDTTWEPPDMSPGNLIRTIVQNWCINSSYLTDPVLGTFGELPPDPGGVYLVDPNIMGMAHPSKFKIPGLSVIAYDNTLPVLNDQTVPYGPVYDAIRDIATAHDLGLRIKLEWATPIAFSLGFYVYLGVDKSSEVRFSFDQGHINNLKKLESIKDTKTLLFGYAPNVDEAAAIYYPTPGYIDLIATTGFDLKTSMTTFEDIDQSMVEDAGGPIDQGIVYTSILIQKLFKLWSKMGKIHLIDGEIVRTNPYIYGQHFKLGDTIEMEADGITQNAKVTEYIRSQDASGEKAYPTVSIIE